MAEKKPINQAVKPQGKSVGQFVEVDGQKIPKAEYDSQQVKVKTAKATKGDK